LFDDPGSLTLPSLKTYTVLVVGSKPTLIAFMPAGIEVRVNVAPLAMVALLLK
jgi:hypothetical protein